MWVGFFFSILVLVSFAPCILTRTEQTDEQNNLMENVHIYTNIHLHPKYSRNGTKTRQLSDICLFSCTKHGCISSVRDHSKVCMPPFIDGPDL